MAKEIERKFLVKNDSYKSLASTHRHIVQAYLSTNIDATIRIRIADDDAFITIKGRSNGPVRNEWEYPIEVADARQMIEFCSQSRVIDKTRWLIPATEEGLWWEVDEFHDSLQGLVIAEIELPSPETNICIPQFVGIEVTGNPEYYNSVLSKK